MSNTFSSVKKLLENLLTSGTYSTYETEIRRKLSFLNALMLLSLVILLTFSIRAYFSGIYIQALADFAIFVITLFTFIITRIIKNGTFGGYAISFFAFIFFLYLVVSGGSAGSGTLWVLSYPFFSIYLLGLKPGAILSVLFFLISSVLMFFFPDMIMVKYNISFSSSYVGSFILIFSLSIVYENIRISNQQKIEESKLQLEENHRKLLNTSQELLREKKQTDSIFNNVYEGIFLIDKELKMDSQYSKALEVIFEEKAIGKKYFLDLLGTKLPEKVLSASRDYLLMFFDLKIDIDLLREANPLEKAELHYEKPDTAGFVTKYLMFSFNRIFQEDGSIYILGTVREVTGEVLLSNKLKYEEDKNKKLMSNLFQIIHIEADLLDEFIVDTESELASINQVLRSQKYGNRDALDFIYKSVHNIKGNANSIELFEFGKKLHALEDEIKTLRDAEKEISWENLLAQTIRIAELQNEINDIKALIEKVLAFQSNINRRKDNGFNYLLRALQSMIVRANQELGKEIELVTNDFDTNLVSDKHRRVIKDICIQLARNSIYHGIETPDERQAMRKSRKGKIVLETKKDNDKVVFIFKDDGCGLDPVLIKEKARLHHAFKNVDIDALSPQQLVSLIFQPGFSTATDTTVNAGRGIGMNFVKSEVSKKGGTIAIRTIKGKSCEFHIALPA